MRSERTRLLENDRGSARHYLQIPGYGEALVQVNNWDMDTLATFRSSNVVKTMGGAIDSVADMTQLQEIDKLIPEEWRPAAVGDAKTCAQRWVDQFTAGADGLIIHASTPEQFAPVLAEYEKFGPTTYSLNGPTDPARTAAITNPAVRWVAAPNDESRYHEIHLQSQIHTKRRQNP